MRPARSKEEQILVWCGVVAQLQRTRANQILAGGIIPYPLFVLLQHFCHDPDREWTVSELTEAFETKQPGMTKKVQKLLDRNLLRSRLDLADGRRRWLSVTRKGVRLRNEFARQLEPDRDQIFGRWSKTDLRTLHKLLDKLRTQLDAEREIIEFSIKGSRREVKG